MKLPVHVRGLVLGAQKTKNKKPVMLLATNKPTNQQPTHNNNNNNQHNQLLAPCTYYVTCSTVYVCVCVRSFVRRVGCASQNGRDVVTYCQCVLVVLEYVLQLNLPPKTQVRTSTSVAKRFKRVRAEAECNTQLALRSFIGLVDESADGVWSSLQHPLPLHFLLYAMKLFGAIFCVDYASLLVAKALGNPHS